MNIKEYITQNQGETTLLGVFPMTEEIVKAAIIEAKNSNFVPMFIATPRQVDGDRGYTGWSQEGLVDFVGEVSDQYRYEGDWVLARDHGGPYQSFRDRGKGEISTARSMEYARELFFQDVEAGFDVVHVDATEDPGVEGRLGLNEIASRTADLISDIEIYIQREDLSEVYYEVGTEEIAGGMTEPDNFERFIELLKNKLDRQGVIDKVLFVVGQVGTTMRIDMTNDFDSDQARDLVDITSDHETYLKVHYTDWLNDSVLEGFPEIGIGAANVGPEFAASQVEGLRKLEKKEAQLLEEKTWKEDVQIFSRPWSPLPSIKRPGENLPLMSLVEIT